MEKEKLKIVFVTPYFTEGMGYINNCLPAEFAKLGHEVYIISSFGKYYFNQKYFNNYKNFSRTDMPDPVKVIDGVTVIRLPHKSIMNTVYLVGLHQKLKEIKPDVVQTFEISSPYVLQLAMSKMRLGYKLFTANHYVLSVFALHKNWNKLSLSKIKWFLLKTTTGYMLSRFSNRCYPATNDARFVAVKYMGMPLRKCTVEPLGVDTRVFRPVQTPEERQRRRDNRASYGYADNDIVCIYTGRFAKDKNPLVLGKAIRSLHEKGYTDFKGFFVGVGEQEEDLKQCKGCQVVPFADYKRLVEFYQMSDVGVWPTQESTSMIDAAACGLPIIVSNQLYARERTYGNGLDYEFENHESLAETLLTLRDAGKRQAMGRVGSERMKHYDWKLYAERRLADYLKY